MRLKTRKTRIKLKAKLIVIEIIDIGQIDISTFRNLFYWLSIVGSVFASVLQNSLLREHLANLPNSMLYIFDCPYFIKHDKSG